MSVTHHHRTKLGILLSLVLAGGLLLLLAVAVVPGRAMPTAATVINVTTTADAVISNGNCSLREAIEAANKNVAVDACPAGSAISTDLIKVPAGTYFITIDGQNENNNDTGDFDILDDVIIRGAGPGLTIIDGSQLDRVFHILNGAEVEIFWLVIQNGEILQSQSDEYGGAGILNDELGTLTLYRCQILSNITDKFGGGLANLGTAKVYESTFTSNVGSQGGAIFNGGGLNLEATTVYGNTASDTGGGLDNKNLASLTNVTISQNNAPKGGGIFNDGNQTIYNSTIAENSQGIHNISGTVRFENTMVANNVSNNCEGTPGGFLTDGHNLDSQDTCKFVRIDDQTGADPMLNPLDDNDGPTLTYALQVGSPAIDHGDEENCPIFDQRGAIRPADGDENGSEICDIGAYEYGAEFPKPLFLPLVIR